MDYDKFTRLIDNLKPYNTKQEKEAVLYSKSINFKTDKLLKILGIDEEDIKDLNDIQKQIVIFRLRYISVGEDIEFNYTCKNCKQYVPGIVNIDSFFDDFPHKDITLGYYTDEEIEHIIPEDLPITEYNELVEKHIENRKSFNTHKTVKCIMCNADNEVDINPVDVISKFSIQDIYKNISELTYYTNNGYNDVMNMLPFEREVFVALTNNIIEKENNGEG
jgi:hypothetical protein